MACFRHFRAYSHTVASQYHLALNADIELPGDFDGSGIVDAADYTVWRNGLATNAYSPEQYGIWKANFGRRNTDGAGAALGEPLAIPEPATFALILTALAWSLRGRCAVVARSSIG